MTAAVVVVTTGFFVEVGLMRTSVEEPFAPVRETDAVPVTAALLFESVRPSIRSSCAVWSLCVRTSRAVYVFVVPCTPIVVYCYSLAPSPVGVFVLCLCVCEESRRGFLRRGTGGARR